MLCYWMNTAQAIVNCRSIGSWISQKNIHFIFESIKLFSHLSNDRRKYWPWGRTPSTSSSHCFLFSSKSVQCTLCASYFIRVFRISGDWTILVASVCSNQPLFNFKQPTLISRNVWFWMWICHCLEKDLWRYSRRNKIPCRDFVNFNERFLFERAISCIG